MVETAAAETLQRAYKDFKSREMLGKLLWKAKLHLQQQVRAVLLLIDRPVLLISSSMLFMHGT
jgi:hypothetical protein